jgi:hypothetical protein
MNQNNKKAWKTKYGPRRVRVEAPTLGEAIVAAQGLTEDLAEQIEIAAGLMGLPTNEVSAELAKLGSGPAKALKLRSAPSVVFAGPAASPRSIVVERKPSRAIRPAARASSTG